MSKRMFTGFSYSRIVRRFIRTAHCAFSSFDADNELFFSFNHVPVCCWGLYWIENMASFELGRYLQLIRSVLEVL